MNMKFKYPFGALFYLCALLMYLATNHNPIYPPQTLPMTWVDQLTPFLPYSVLIYVSEFVFFGLAYYLLRKTENINKFIYSIFTVQLLSNLIFLIYPTTYPRHEFPLPQELPTWLSFVWNTLRQQDTPGNCFPSLHVSSVFLTAFVFIDEERPKLFWGLFTWAILITFSTLTTKQHYLADVVSGFTLAFIVFWLFHRKFRYSETAPSPSALNS